MDIVEKFHNKFGRWYGRLFNESSENGLRPKDVLRKILDAMEENRSEGFDGKVYVPNKYVLELGVPDQDQRDYLLSFLDEEELSAVLQRYMTQNGYSTRGPLDFTIRDAEPGTTTTPLTVKARFEKGPAPAANPAPTPPAAPAPAAEALVAGAGMPAGRGITTLGDDDLLTIASPREEEPDEELTVAAVPVAWAALNVVGPDGHRTMATLAKPMFTIGRSRMANNDLVVSGDGQMSKRHARIERETDGRATLYDLDSMNGIVVNGKTVSGNVTLSDGDQITMGATRMVFIQDERIAQVDKDPRSVKEDGADSPELPISRARLIPDTGGNGHPLASETLIGRAVTADIVLDDSESATRQAQVISPDVRTYYLQDLAGRETTRVNGRPLYGEERIRLIDGDIVQLGGSRFTFVQSKAGS